MLTNTQLAFMVGLLCAGCGNTVNTTGSGGATTSAATTTTSTGVTSTTSVTTSTGTTGTGGGMAAPGECKTSADCPPDGTCIELIVGGYRVCQYPVTDATSCTVQGVDECCKTSDCTGAGERCIFQPYAGPCGGVAIEPHNQCVKDQCAGPADCNAQEICAPAGTLGNKIRVCLPAPCHQVNCIKTQESVGFCAAIKNPCCSASLGLYCARDCLTDMDCPGGYCDVDSQGLYSACKMGSPTCPG